MQLVGGSGAAGAVTISRYPAAFAADGQSEVVLPLTVTPGPTGNPAWAAGYFEVTLPSESAYAGTGYYVIEEPGDQSHAFQVPETVGPHWLGDIVTAVTSSGGVLPVPLSALRDTAPLAAATNGQVPSWDTATARWVPITSTGGGGSVSDATTTSKGIVQLAGDLAGTAAAPTVPGLTGKAALSHQHAASDLTSGTLAIVRVPLGSTSSTVCVGDDARLSDSRAPTGAASGSLAGTYPGPSITAGAVGGTELAAAIKDPAAGTAGLRTLGTSGTSACAGNDTRLSDSRTPTAHATSHASGGSDPVTPAAIGAVASALVDAKGDLVVATAADTLARLAVGGDGTEVVADSGQATGVKWQRRLRGIYPPSADALIAVPADLVAFRDNSALGAAAWAVRLFIPAGEVITTCWSTLHSAGTVGAGGENSFALYTDVGDLVTSTVTDDNLWATTTGPRSKALPAPIAAQSIDRYIYAAVRVTGYLVAPTFAFVTGSSNAGLLDGPFGAGRRRSLVLGGSTWAATIDTAAGTSGGGYLPFIALA